MNPVFRALRPEEQAECLDLWAQVFSPSRDYFERYFRDPLWQPHYTRVCEVGGRLVAAMQLVRRPVRLGNGQTLWMAGIANVATLPEFRGRGFASRLLQDLHAVMDAEDFAFGLLFTGIHDFYGRLGWERLPLPLYEATPAPVDLAGWRFRTAEPNDLPLIQGWYEAFYSDHPLSVQRDDAYWRVWTRWDDPKWRSKFYIAEDSSGAPRGYIALETHHGADEQGNRVVREISIAELGCEPNDLEAARMLIGFASQTAHMAGAQLELFLPEADMERLVRPLLPDVRWVGNGGAMVRVCDWERVFQWLERPAQASAEETARAGTPVPPAWLERPAQASAEETARAGTPVPPAWLERPAQASAEETARAGTPVPPAWLERPAQASAEETARAGTPVPPAWLERPAQASAEETARAGTPVPPAWLERPAQASAEETARAGTPVPQAVALALLFGLPIPENAPIAPDLRERCPLRPACYSPVDSF